MTQDNGSRYTPGYDLFKLIVAVILTIILILLLLQESRIRYAALSLTVTASSFTERAALPTMASSPLPEASSTPTASPTSTELVPTQTAVIESPSTAITSTEEIPPEPVPTQEVPTATPTSEPVSTQPVAASNANANACPANDTRLQTGATVRVLDWLNFRTGPGLQYEIQRTNRPGTELEVIGGPVCTVRGGDPPRAYLWWNVRMKDGREGWSAEAPLNFPNYFLEPQ